MAALKRAYNARSYHEAKNDRTHSKLQEALRNASRAGIEFRSVTALANYVATQCDQTPGNLRRNTRHRLTLEQYLLSQRGSPQVHLSRDREGLKVKLRVAELEASNALRDKKRLEAYISTRLDLMEPAQALLLPSNGRHGEVVSQIDYKMAFECTAHALSLVLEQTGTFRVDQPRATIVDLAARPGSEDVVGPKYASYYVDWIKCRPK